MMRSTLLTGLVAGMLAGPLVAQRSVEEQIADATFPLPPDLQSGATVLGSRDGAYPVVLREGDNHFICLADDPSDNDRNRYQSSCYHRSLEPFMARGRALRAEGVTGRDVWRLRGEEIARGELEMPQQAGMFTVRGEIDPATGIPDSVRWLRVLYVPFATTEATGFPERPLAQGQPWLMQPGMHRAHIMIPGETVPFRPDR